jgi:hypothetical protein
MRKMSEENEPKWNDAEWAIKMEPLEAFNTENEENENDDVQDVIETAKMQIRRGNKNPMRRERAWRFLHDIYKDVVAHGLENPMPSKGQTSTKYLSIQEGLDHVAQTTETAITAAFEAAPEYALHFFRREGSGDDQIRHPLTIEQIVKREIKSEQDKFKKLFDENKWDGTEAGIPAITNATNGE